MSSSVREGATDLYRFFDANGRLLYVGISFSAIARASQHRADKAWWPDVARMDVEHLRDRRTAVRMERLAIATENPAYNVLRPTESTSHRRFRVGDNEIIVVDAVLRHQFGFPEFAVLMCPGCGGTHRHGVREIERHTRVAYRYPHCQGSGAWGRLDYMDMPWQVLRITAPKPAEPYTVTDDDRWFKRRDRIQFRSWRKHARASA